MKRKFLRRLQANFQSVIMCSITFGMGAYCGMAHNLLKEGCFVRFQAVALLVGFSAIGIGTVIFSLFYLIFGRTAKECARNLVPRVIEDVKLAYTCVSKALEKARHRQIQEAGMTIFVQQSRI